MLFSIIIPLYNKEDTIERTVLSVVAQTCHDWELIVVNDGSTDNSLSVIQRLSKNIPMRIIDKINGGVSSARNIGASVALGEYIALLDGDDIWYSNHLSRIEVYIKKYPEIGFLGAGYERSVGDYIYYTIPWGGAKISDVYSMFMYGQRMNSSSVVINRNLWQKIGGFNDHLSFYEDYEFFFRLGIYTQCCVIRKINCRYTDDAKIQATKKKYSYNRVTMPHVAFLDMMISRGNATHSMRRFAKTHAKIQYSLYNVGLSQVSPEQFAQYFPEIAQLTSKLHKSRLFGYIFLFYYRIRNHFLIWRHNAKRIKK